MFDHNQDFYPTPIEVARYMVLPYCKVSDDDHPRHHHAYLKKGTVILEPSAGKGDLLKVFDKADENDDDYIGEKYPKPGEPDRVHKNPHVQALVEKTPWAIQQLQVREKEIYTIEADPELQHILRDKGYKVVANDFLTYNPDELFDLIIMNPPFSNGEHHLLKAWDVLHHGHIACLLNAETIRNPHTKYRELLNRIIEANGSVEYLGPVFSTAERETDVDVALVRLYKPIPKDKFNFTFDEITSEKQKQMDGADLRDLPTVRDIVASMTDQFDIVKEKFVDFTRIMAEMTHYGNPLLPKKTYEGDLVPDVDIAKIALEIATQQGSLTEKYSEFVGIVRKHMWRHIFQKMRLIADFDIDKLLTHSVRQNWEQFQGNQGNMAFTKENIWGVIEMIFTNKETIMERAVEEVFDILTKYHKDNQLHIEGWKTNDKFKVKKKVILPYGIHYGQYMNASSLSSWGDNMRINYNKSSEYSDIDKVMCYITGKDTANITSFYSALERRLRIIGNVKTGDKFDNTGESTFFRFKFWKKGTIHLEFKDDKLWQEFNMRACAAKKWLPYDEEMAWRKSKEPEQPVQPKQEPVKQLGYQTQMELV